MLAVSTLSVVLRQLFHDCAINGYRCVHESTSLGISFWCMIASRPSHWNCMTHFVIKVIPFLCKCAFLVLSVAGWVFLQDNVCFPDLAFVQVNMTMDREDCVLNTGVFMMDLPKFQSYRIGQRIKELVVRHKIRTIWVKNSIKAPLILALQGHVQRRVANAWNCDMCVVNPYVQEMWMFQNLRRCVILVPASAMIVYSQWEFFKLDCTPIGTRLEMCDLHEPDIDTCDKRIVWVGTSLFARHTQNVPFLVRCANDKSHLHAILCSRSMQSTEICAWGLVWQQQGISMD